MKVVILENGSVKHNGHILEPLERYDLPDNVAESLIASGNAKLVDQSKSALPEPSPLEPETPKFNPKKSGYVAAAIPQKPLAPDEVDETPVVGNKHADKTPLPASKTKFYDESGKEITEEEARELEQKGSGTVTKPTAAELSKAKTVK